MRVSSTSGTAPVRSCRYRTMARSSATHPEISIQVVLRGVVGSVSDGHVIGIHMGASGKKKSARMPPSSRKPDPGALGMRRTRGRHPETRTVQIKKRIFHVRLQRLRQEREGNVLVADDLEAEAGRRLWTHPSCHRGEIDKKRCSWHRA